MQENPRHRRDFWRTDNWLIEDPFFEKYNVRTDLALEAHEVVTEKEGQTELPGVKIQNQQTDFASLSRVTVENEIGAKTIGKRPGHYSTIESPALRQHNREVQENIAQMVAQELDWFLQQAGLSPEATVLVVGLGNWNATPDAVGPKVIDKMMVTRHLIEMSPPELRQGVRPVAAISPGVLGLTGVETGEIVRGIVSQINADAVICVDALASRSTSRLCSTIQISDTGINPGAGVGNRRLAINQETLGIPVIAIGVPTVVHAVTIVSDAVDLLNGNRPASESETLGPTQMQVNPNQIIGGPQPGPMGAGNPGAGIKKEMIQQILQPYMGTMIVTPKEIDELVEDISQVIAGALNTTFHEGVDYNEIFQYLS